MSCLIMNKGSDTLTPLPLFVVMWGMFWQRRSASYLVNIRYRVKSDKQKVYSGPHVYEI